MVVWLCLRKKGPYLLEIHTEHLWMKYDIWDLIQINTEGARWLGVQIWQDWLHFDGHQGWVMGTWRPGLLYSCICLKLPLINNNKN